MVTTQQELSRSGFKDSVIIIYLLCVIHMTMIKIALMYSKQIVQVLENEMQQQGTQSSQRNIAL